MLCIRDDLTAKLFTTDKSTKSCIVELNLKLKKQQMKYLETPTETLFLPNLIELFMTQIHVLESFSGYSTSIQEIFFENFL